MKTIQTPPADYQTLAMELVESRNIIDKFINSCSHSLRAPLKTIKGLAYVLEKNNQSESETMKLLKLINHTTLKMEGVLTQLEQFLQNSRSEIVVEPLDLKQLVGDVVREHQESLEGQLIDVSFEVKQSQPFLSDPKKIRLILSQIISNAVQFYDSEKARSFIKIKVHVLSTSCEISILDNGIGIAHENQDKIFKLFYRGSEKSKGAGIGLYIAREAVEKIGGKISVDSRQHLGSKFFLWVPSQAA